MISWRLQIIRRCREPAATRMACEHKPPAAADAPQLAEAAMRWLGGRDGIRTSLPEAFVRWDDRDGRRLARDLPAGVRRRFTRRL